ncbi:Glucose N-acetyltransferase 1-like protein 3 [Colletotrichum chlorophyti]|uniref:Glucose N-acetyltransferase 1-like protein 3 n=1 Tax=Colletotrichum chlorophyti TaxID=708187 RepID=A0A1Q8RSQ4_9PEZI|nr:Glucose N-acetyltransferase 1-like protein 3 [Colletotrichum chlorophyti]
MLVSTRRTVTFACVVFAFVLLTGYQSIKHSYVSNPLRVLKNDTISAPALTTELERTSSTGQLEPRFAYVINFNRLERFGVKHDLVLVFPKDWAQGKSKEAKAIKQLHAASPRILLRPFELLAISKQKGPATWSKSINKFHAFALTEYARVLVFDSDSQVLNNMDTYFLTPKAAIAVPRAYWLNEMDAPAAEQVVGSHVMLIEPDKERYEMLVDEALKSGEVDMDIMNRMFRRSALILPHRRLALLTGEFRRTDHRKYLAPDEDEEWDAVDEASKSYLVHFSDWPLPKPWLPHTTEEWQAALPDCPETEDAQSHRSRCADREVWSGFYEDYNADRKQYCKRWV